MTSNSENLLNQAPQEVMTSQRRTRKINKLAYLVISMGQCNHKRKGISNKMRMSNLLTGCIDSRS
jgi:hypothetical protein